MSHQGRLGRVLIVAAILCVAIDASADLGPLPDWDPGDPNDPTDCGTRAEASDDHLAFHTGDLDLCVIGNIVILASDGLVGDSLEIHEFIDFSYQESQDQFSNQFLPPADTPLMAVVLGDALIDWGAYRSNVRLVATGGVSVVVPEPAPAALFGAGLLALAEGRRRRHAR